MDGEDKMSHEEEEYVTGDLVYKTARWATSYPGWKISRGIVIQTKKSFVTDEALSAYDRTVYQNRYGKREQYPVFEILITTSEGNYLVSQFGFNKDPDKKEKEND